MNRLVTIIGLTIFIGWTAALIVNYSIYSEDPGPALTTPFFDGILFMALMLGMYFFLWKMYQAKQQTATIMLSAGGVLALIGAVILL